MTPAKPIPEGHQRAGLRPPDSHPEPGLKKNGKPGLVGAALPVVVILGLVLVLLLPKLVSETSNETVAEATNQAIAGSVQLATQELASSRTRAEQALRDFLHVRARLELANAPIWGEPEWSKALEGVTKGNRLFGQRQFSMATEVLIRSVELLLLLESETGQRLANALNSGWQSLRADDSSSAEVFFETAISIDGDNETAMNGLEQAQVRPDLLDLMAAGELALSMNDLAGARIAYIDAAELDGAYEPAEIALLDVSEQIDNLAFMDAMSRALSALETEQVEVAETALRQAASLKPGDEMLHNTQQQLAQTRQKLWIARQRTKVASQERNEDWSGAAATYREVLVSVPQASFARQGLAFALDREHLHRQFDHYLTDPTRIYSDEPRTNAEQLLESVAIPPAAETRLAEKVRRLQTLVIEAQTPRLLVLQSDGLTSVQIYHVGRLGQFTSRQLELRPGTYTVVGSRPGYRDVRQTFTVKPGSDQPALDIRCEEPI